MQGGQDLPGGLARRIEDEVRDGRDAGGPRLRQIQPSIAVAAVQGRVQIARAAGDVGAVVDQLLREAVPAGDLVARKILVHTAHLGTKRVTEIDVVGGLVDRLPRGAVLVVAPGILELRVHVEARLEPEQIGRSPQLRVERLLIPATASSSDLALGLLHVLARVRSGGLGNEVEVTAHL